VGARETKAKQIEKKKKKRGEGISKTCSSCFPSWVNHQTTGFTFACMQLARSKVKGAST
jgi:hypothetical protein